MKRRLLLLMVIVLCITVVGTFSLASCQKTETTEETKEETAAEETAEEEKEEETSGERFTYVDETFESDSMANVVIPERTGDEAPPTEKEFPIKIGFCPTTMNTAYQMNLLGCKMTIDKYGGKDNIELIIQTPSSESGIEEQMNIIEGWLQQGDFDAIALCTANDNALNPVYRKAVEQGIPIFVWNMPFATLDNPYYVCDIGYSQFDSGKLAGEWVAEQFCEEGCNVAILEGLPGIHQQQRGEGFLTGFADCPKIEIVASQPADWNREKGQAVTENILTAHDDIDVLWGMYDEMPLGGLAAVKAADRLDEIKILGYDGTPDAIEAIQRGEMFGTTYTGPVEQGMQIIEQIVQYVVNGEIVPKVVYVESTWYDQSNIDEFPEEYFDIDNILDEF
jgi:ribose transport system substrate-binding protein